MKKRVIGYLLLILVVILGLTSFPQSRRVRSLMPHLPAPIAAEKALVTPAGQGPEGLIVSEICDALNINNSFMYWAEPEDLRGFNSLIIVLGFSKQGLHSLHKEEEEEIERVSRLIQAAERQNIPVVLIHLGGPDRRGAVNDALAEVLAVAADYIIVTQDGERDGFFTALADKNNIPVTIVSGVTAVKVPLNSVFR
ncbi:DUF6305 family protein [Phosphitispora fastidiosa]|uniref:DUF6305 family protein n=1 Tax=Phosphitispora fastidiosa TaxID=2837202 RepID=UPI001E4CE528|nr:DUF6305 family protein [Phosphitispora fastidiosa]MBU7006949.1 hypothetical protein [Phosphitispora fastidiosa]